MLAHAIAGALDLNDDGVMKQPVEQRGGDDRIAEDVAPFGKAAVGSEDHGALFVAGIDELEEQVGAAWGNRQIADLVDDEQRTAAQEADFLAQRALAFSLGKDGNEVGQRDEVDAFAGADGLDGECRGEMGFAGARRDRGIVPDTRGRTRRSATPFILASAAGSRSYGVIRSVVSPCWWSNSPTERWRWCRSG